MLATVVALVPEPCEQAWREGVYSVDAEPGALRACNVAVSAEHVKFVHDAAIPPEGYRIDVSADGIAVASSDDAGAFYAMMTLKQAATVIGDRKNGFRLSIPCGTVIDAPAFRWRGFMLDEGRHFFGKEVVKHLLELIAEHKLNVFHWHLTEDQGWRLAIDRFPELVKYGSVRPRSVAHGSRGLAEFGDCVFNTEPYGPYFYTADDVREILAFAKARHIAVVPEIEMPGHIRALLAAHPEFSCKGDLSRVPHTYWTIEEDVLCAGNDDAIRFMEQVLDEVCELFPGAYVHIGGDECPKKRWRECPKCQARIKALGLKDEDALQAWVTRHFTDYLAKKGRRAIGWDEVFAGSPGKETIIQCWHIQHGNKFGLLAAEAGYPVIVSDMKRTYFSLPQGVQDDPFTYLSPDGRCSLETAYSFDPMSGMTDAAAPHVLGAECCMWSECTWNIYDLDFKLWPRVCAFAETMWAAPKVPRDFADFVRRMTIHRRRLIAAGVNCAPLE